jgi:hypothetical protein
MSSGSIRGRGHMAPQGVGGMKERCKLGATLISVFAMCNRNDPEEELLFALRTAEGDLCAGRVAAARAIKRVTAIWIVTRTRHDHILF